MKTKQLIAFFVLGVGFAVPSFAQVGQLVPGDIILMTSSGLTHVRSAVATPVVPIAIDANPVPANWLNGSIEYVPGTPFCLAGADLSPFGLFLIDFTTSLSSPSSVRLGTGVGGIRDIDVLPNGDVAVLQNVSQTIGRIDIIAAPITIFSALNTLTPFATALQSGQADYMAAITQTQIVYGGIANIYSVNQGATTAGGAITLGSTTIFYSMVAADYDVSGSRFYSACFNPDYVRKVQHFGGTSFADAGAILQFPEIDGPDDCEWDQGSSTIWCVARNGGTVLGVPWGVQLGNDNALIGAVLDSSGNLVSYTTTGPLGGHGNSGLFGNIAVVGTSPASVGLYGVGCTSSASTPFVLGAIGTPQIGSTSFQIAMAGGQANALCFIYLAVGQSNPPVPFGPCNVYLDLTTLFAFISSGFSPLGPFPLDGSGNLTFGLPIPNQSSLIGQYIDTQAAAQDALSPIGVVLSNGMRLNFGP